ncbi:MAG: GH3 auxin-responsive promoter family protein [Bacteroidales bacterium]|nr:GH3 auxin-responsive promoter family protein [Bacteroidales bacterium]
MDFTRLSRIFLDRIYEAELRAEENLQTGQRKLLGRLLREARGTRFGRENGFDAIRSYEDFAEKLPIADYTVLRPYVMEMIKGEKDLLAPGRTRYFAQSSGTSDGKSKYIPVTDSCLSRGHYSGAAFTVASYLHNYRDSHIFGGRNFILGGSFANELTLSPGTKVGDLSATLIDRINPVANLFRIPSKKIALMEHWEEKLPALVKASVHADIRSLSGVPSWFLTVLKEVLNYTGAENIHQVWPNLEVFMHGGIAFGPYRRQYAAITDPTKMRYWETYNASEGFFGVQAVPGSPSMRLLMNTDVFYEFVPAGNPEATPIPAWNVRPGEVYALLITSSNGLWRYPLGDTVKITGTEPLTITIAGRTKSFINAFGEEVMVFNTDAAIDRTCHQTGAEVLNYTAAPVYADGGRRGRHQWLIEFAIPPADIEQFADLLDTNLQQENSDYQAKRSGNIFLDRLSVTAGTPGVFDRWLASTGKLGGQRKVPRLSNDRRIMDPLLAINSAMASASHNDQTINHL